MFKRLKPWILLHKHLVGQEEAYVEQFFLLEDPTTSSYSDDFDQVHITEVSVPLYPFVSEVLDTTSPDLDMFLLVDEGDGAYLYTYSATATAYEKIDFKSACWRLLCHYPKL